MYISTTAKGAQAKSGTPIIRINGFLGKRFGRLRIHCRTGNLHNILLRRLNGWREIAAKVDAGKAYRL